MFYVPVAAAVIYLHKSQFISVPPIPILSSRDITIGDFQFVNSTSRKPIFSYLHPESNPGRKNARAPGNSSSTLRRRPARSAMIGIVRFFCSGNDLSMIPPGEIGAAGGNWTAGAPCVAVVVNAGDVIVGIGHVIKILSGSAGCRKKETGTASIIPPIEMLA
jgi:hypothetical protein